MKKKKKGISVPQQLEAIRGQVSEAHARLDNAFSYMARVEELFKRHNHETRVNDVRITTSCGPPVEPK